jgi:hypothetical protein
MYDLTVVESEIGRVAAMGTFGRLDKSAFRARTVRSGNAERASIGDDRRTPQPAARAAGRRCHGEPADGISRDLVEHV